MATLTQARLLNVVVVIVHSIVISTSFAEEPQRKPEPPLTYPQLRTMAEDGVTGFDLAVEAELRSLSFVLSADHVKELLELGVESHVIHHLTLSCLPLQPDFETLFKCFTEQRYDRAIEAASLLLDKAPKCLIARWLRGRCLIEKREWAGALADFEWCHTEAPQFIPRAKFIDRPARSVVMIARVHRLSGDTQKAIAMLDRHLVEYPSSTEVEVFLERALAHGARQEILLARADFLASLKADPLSLPVYLSAAELLTTCESNRDATTARSLAMAAVELAGSSADRYKAYAALAAADAELTKFDAAVDWQQRAVAAAPAHRQQELEDRVAVYRRHETSWPAAKPETSRQTSVIDRFADIRKSLVEIKGERFRMGSDRGAPDEGPVHEVEVADFLISRCEVTRGDWRFVMGEGPSSQPELPVEGVSWEECHTFIERLNRLKKNASVQFRLPTEAEWEFAARNGTDTLYFFGDDGQSLSDYAWFSENSEKRPHACGTRKPNSLGLCDLYGNVEEWCADPYVRYSRTADSKPPETGIVKVLRGGSWLNSAARCTSSARSAAPAKERRRGAGFRLAADKPSKPEPTDQVVENASVPQKAAAGPDLLDEAAESLSIQLREAKSAWELNRYRLKVSQLSHVIAHTRLAEGKPAEALAHFRKIQDVITDPQSLDGWQVRCVAAWIQATCSPELKPVYDPAAAAEAALAAVGVTGFKEWLPYAVLAAAHAESGDFEKAVLRAQQALDQAPAEVRDDCRARLENYKARHTSRGTRPPLSLLNRP